MFSDVSLKEIRQQLKKSHNNVEQCVHVLLQAQDKGTRCLKQKSSMEVWQGITSSSSFGIMASVFSFVLLEEYPNNRAGPKYKG